ncbi:Oidioi.mRNA.OKI2018_I69.PAR.g11832.t1.cds [Oikopleura dioica]|uniref:Oidioi.mRNA.OKI2018_I69.PAR.g11832.t1.cds n=1 Tax=Oikopleura dioica TaxID=34765 RepID=A0ABN7RXK5_OIKDI|nr:Oidioi.mRNA.OKI2018_I69.PAR.g11832.t1.cds [Oikopleura dioica]
MGDSKKFLMSPPPVDPVAEKLADILSSMEKASQENIKKLNSVEHEDCLMMTEFTSNSLINYTSPVSPVKVAQTKRLKKLRDSSDSEDLLILRQELQAEQLKSKSLQEELQKSLKREQLLRSQCEDLFQALERNKLREVGNSAKLMDVKPF